MAEEPHTGRGRRVAPIHATHRLRLFYEGDDSPTAGEGTDKHFRITSIFTMAWPGRDTTPHARSTNSRDGRRETEISMPGVICAHHGTLSRWPPVCRRITTQSPVFRRLQAGIGRCASYRQYDGASSYSLRRARHAADGRMLSRRRFRRLDISPTIFLA